MRDVLFAVAVVLVLWVVVLGVLLVLGRKVAAVRLVALVPNLVVLFRGLVSDDRVPLGSKLLLGAGLVWIVSPIDLIPEFVPALGPIDDAIVGALVLRHVARRAGPHVIAAHWRGDAATLKVLLRVAGVRRRDLDGVRLPA